MSIIKRMSVTLFSRIDQVLGEIENHGALIKASIGEQKKKITAARLQLNRIRAQLQQISAQESDLAANERLWTQRAIKESAQDESKALACLERRNQARQQQEKLVVIRNDYQRTADRMALDLSRCEQALQQMTQKHQLLRARQSSADAMQVIGADNSVNLDQLQHSFDRWEIKLAQAEPLDQAHNVDELEQCYLTEEHEQALRTELATLLKQENSHDNM